MAGPRPRALSLAEFGGRMRIFTVNAAIENGSPLRALIGTPMGSWPQRRDRIQAAVTHCGLRIAGHRRPDPGRGRRVATRRTRGLLPFPAPNGHSPGP